MPKTSERTFGNRLEHGRALQVALDKIAGYSPDNANLTPTKFKQHLDAVEAANNTVASSSQTLSDARTSRRLAYFGDVKQGVPGLATLAARVRDTPGSMAGGKHSPSYKQIQRLTQKISNYRPPKKPVTAPPGGPNANKKEISQSEASYGSLVQAGRDLAAAAAQVPGYNPTATDLQPAALTASMTALANHNKTVTTALVEVRNAVAARAELYDGEQTGLKSQFQQAKAAVAAQFGRRSAEYKTIVGLRY
ncbi:MAG TPA: hypothetical protein VGW39_16530 [Chthoniobacterales bacterium]|nr:hypothetical protein [Chthoniobacterales bacterium]